MEIVQEFFQTHPSPSSGGFMGMDADAD
jgi:hypothetical protein